MCIKLMKNQINHLLIIYSTNILKSQQNKVVGDTVSDFGLPWDLLAEIDFLV